ncbi:hypothetical protein CAEBREN_25705 [Caenorhabditis brenneri]|uniref:Uncharacterized protein n=1 Tax=Caenorhabditis brenneri TaxID=135651 RepID=G0PBE2_CAEBE|nr:hypothetical protein CAEBREN_25705 [Caenorhabditis brenneri]
MSSGNWIILQYPESNPLEKLQTEHKKRMEWERKILQQTIDKLVVELKEKKESIAHLEDCVKGEAVMITILKKVINESEIRHTIDYSLISRVLNIQ